LYHAARAGVRRDIRHAARSTPCRPGIIERLNAEINAGLSDPTVKVGIAQATAVPLLLSPAQFGAHMAAEIEKWGKVIRAANIKPE
jgi:tripartite-type tricarboxylate transporter receptor subunit TctC